MISPIFLISIVFMLVSVLSSDAGLRQDQTSEDAAPSSVLSKEKRLSSIIVADPTKSPTAAEDLSFGEESKSKKPRRSKKPSSDRTKKPLSVPSSPESSQLTADSTIQSQIAGKVTCEGDYSYACSGCEREGDFCCNKECTTILCTEIAEYCQI